MSHQEKPQKLSKQLRSKAQEFLSTRKNPDLLLQIVRYLESNTDLPSCLLTVELIFNTLLKDRSMYIELIPLKPIEKNEENQYKEWLRSVYENSFTKILECLENEQHRIQIQGLSTAMSLISNEGRFPLETKGNLECYVPLQRLKCVIMRLLSSKQNNTHLINKFTEYLCYDDILFFTWKLLPSLTAKTNPIEVYIINYLTLLEKLALKGNEDVRLLCHSEGIQFTFDSVMPLRSLNKLWHCIMLWQHTPITHRQLLVVLLERALPHLDKPLLLTDFLMESLDVGGAVGLLALQGIFTLVQTHNITYPDVFAKLYSMFEPEIFHTKYKARLFYLGDLFLSSTHLPEGLVAAFAKRLARLALVAPSEDVEVICMFIGNLILRHPGLKCLLNHPQGGSTTSDPYIMEERDPLKSNAIHSSLWELQTLQYHSLPSVATAARFINNELPRVEWDLGRCLDNTSDDIFDKELKKNSKLLALAFEKPKEGALLKYWGI